MTIHHFSLIGKRQYQEDCIAIAPDEKLFIVCDGVGGSKHGAVASKLVCDSVIKNYTSRINSFTSSQLVELIDIAQQDLCQAVVEHPEYKGMATTYVLMYLHDDQVSVSHMGDSRALVLSQSSDVAYETRDDSLVQRLLEDGTISSAKDVLSHPLRHMLTKSLHATASYFPPLQNIALNLDLPSDFIILIGTDGIYENFTSFDIGAFLRSDGSLLEDKWKAFKVYCQSMAKDNASAILIEPG